MKSFTKLLTRVVRRELYREDKAMFSCRRLFFVSSTRASLLQQNQNTFDASYPLKSLPTSSFNSTKWGLLGAQKRSMFIQTQPTPNPSSLMFYPGKPVMEVGSADFPNARSAMNSPLAKALYGIDAIMDFYTSGQPLFIDSSVAASMDTAIREDDSETVAMIKELLETRIRPAVQDDGGDIEYRGFNPETGVVKLRMQGACSGCPSSSVTLKSGIENMLMHYVQELTLKSSSERTVYRPLDGRSSMSFQKVYTGVLFHNVAVHTMSVLY
ncbi:nifU-like protein 4, mitochondrial isoform X3 [Macadamia integrifolia]|uniref:nifU-like protein 4, mitochondrial isoform X3 n=1 Tax=Macadamia integrifolia TaxID=60698 RepID=UPI001C4F8553|nr:nifU-like protein 4, mitochondrial isoform X3 [Macadamia integrifolia]